MSMFKKILIANRGEIACRIIKTARSMGIHSVAVYSSVDKDSLHVQLADSAYCIGDAGAKDSYLNIVNIIEAALNTQAQAIHPGYGFLSENPEFAKACSEAGLIFIGPSVEAMEAMASKQLAKQLLAPTSVPLTPGYHGENQEDHFLLQEAKKIGFPVLIKAANGGGGKGMRAVTEEAQFFESLAAARREAMASFAEDTMILEKLLLNPRHIEVQVMADNFGSVIHLFERDCSIQRRHQKIIEEAPAPFLSESLRHNLTKAACEVAQSINYVGAGTVEFLVDAQDHFYFMEMNTRLQVEHPVTEMITGLDLVAWQLKIAANEPLPLTQNQIQIQGHALECRIYAEDPFNGFIPSIGTLNFLKEPHFAGLRIDTGVQTSSTVTQYYDPMIAKLIAWGENREEALQRLQQGLAHYFIGGIKTNIPFLQAISSNSQFVKGLYHTDFLSQESLVLGHPDKESAFLMALCFDYLNLIKQVQTPLQKDTFSWQLQNSGHWIWRYQDEEHVVEAQITPIGNHQFFLKLEGKEAKLSAQLIDDCILMTYENQNYKAWVQNSPLELTLYTEHGSITISRFAWNRIASKASHRGQLVAPMPATIIAVLKKMGDPVKSGEGLMILEAMKMEHTIHAPSDGIVQELFYSLGDQVTEGAELVSLTESKA